MMTPLELEQAILDLIRKYYCAEYDQKIKVIKIPTGYILKLSLNNHEYPYSIVFEGTDQEFLEGIKNDLLNSHFDHVDYFYGYKQYRIKDCDER